jgi:hypothetical protein
MIATAMIRWSDPRLRGGWAAIALAALVWLALAPRTLTNSDEVFYAGEARMLASGHLQPRDGDPLPVDPEHPREAARVPLGWPLVLAPFALLGLRAMFLATLAFHLFAGAAVARLLTRRGLPSLFAALWLFHPTAWIYSRTLMADVPASALLLLAIDAAEEDARLRSAALLGAAVFLRLTMVVAAGGFLLALLVRTRSLRALVPFVAACAIGGAGLVLGNLASTGALVSTHYQGAGLPFLDGRMAGENALLYSAGLLALPPFPLVWLAARRARVDAWAWVAPPVFVFFVIYSFHDRSPNLLETLVGGQRYLLPAHAALLIATARAWSMPRLAPLALAAGAATCLYACVKMRRIEARYLPAVEAIRACHPRRLAFNEHAARVALAVDAQEYQLIDRRAVTGLGDLFVVTPQSPSHTGEGARMFAIPDELRRLPSFTVGAFTVFADCRHDR